MTATQADEHVRYEPDERPPWPVAAGVGAQAALVTVPGVVITVVIVARIAEQPESYISWAVFAAMLISGATTVLQAARVGRVGAGHVLIMGTSGAFIAVCVAALVEGGPATMASLIVISSLFQFAMASRLSLLRRVFTPVMAGTVIMLIAATVMPIVFDTLVDVPADASDAAGPVTGLATIGVVLGLVLRGPAAWRLWSPLAGVVVGCAVAGLFGIYDLQPVLDAAWIGVPGGGWPGFDVTPGEEFWALLPAFIVVTLVGAVETVGDGIAIQRVSRRAPRATDFRVVQGALNADGMGNLLSGLAGTLPITTNSSSISLAEVTGVAARTAGI
ncbi:MAG: xanthine/uracil/vitamin C permease, partial [Chloroflexi bacterium]|nr:xanthine/uracil/vitamin C permease [Chloroflexota bacterium]